MRLPSLICLCIAAAMLTHGVAEAAIVFTPHLSEYGILPRGAYADHTFIYTRIDKIFDQNGDKKPLGDTAIPPGSTVDASLLLFRYLWIGNPFEHSSIPFLNDHDEVFRVIGNLGWQQGKGDIPDLSRKFGLKSGGSGLGDLFLLGGIYGKNHHWGVANFNGLGSFTAKVPIGDYDTRALLNTGTHYWTYIPQLSGHADFWGRLNLDGTAAYQLNGRNNSPAYGGLTPTKPADVYNLELNAAWKFTEHWFADVGYGWRKSVGPNEYDKVTLNFKDQPLPATTACNSGQAFGIVVPPEQCSLTDRFFIRPRAGQYRDRGTEGALLTTSLYYVYRASSVINFRAAIPVSGKGGQITVPYDVYTRDPRSNPTATPIASVNPSPQLTAVQEAGSVSASPFYELRFVYLFWAP